jgi:Putative auto-transporter adhesin, head GIN domain
MNKRKTILLTGLPLILFVMACQIGPFAVNIGERISEMKRGSGNVVEETRPVEGFNKIDLQGLGEVNIEYGDQESLRVEAEDNLIGSIQTDVRSRTLEIGIEKNTNIVPTKPIRFFITVTELDSLEVSGAGSIHASSIDAQDFEISIGGLGNAEIGELQVDRLDVQIGGSGDVVIHDGSVNKQTITIDGLGSYRAGDLPSQAAEVAINGAGSATVWATDTLDATVSGLGGVSYYGTPEVSLERTGLGNLNSLGDK